MQPDKLEVQVPRDKGKIVSSIQQDFPMRAQQGRDFANKQEPPFLPLSYEFPEWLEG